MGSSIAIDGPAGAGKSTVAKRVAGRLGFQYVDTGAMYRAIALYMIRQKISAESGENIEKALEAMDLKIRYVDGKSQVFLEGENVTAQLREEEVGRMSSRYSANPAVRRQLVALQQRLAAEHNVVMDGRDIGTCVLPDADLKLFLTADVKVRAQRRAGELREQGQEFDLEAIARDIAQRDKQDMEREFSPLRQAEDAILLDTSDMDIDQVVEFVLDSYEKRQGSAG